MTKIFVHCFLDENQKKYLEDNFSVNVHNANEKILSPDEITLYKELLPSDENLYYDLINDLDDNLII